MMACEKRWPINMKIPSESVSSLESRNPISARTNAPRDVGKLTRQSGVPALKSGEHRDAKLFHTASKSGRRPSKDSDGTATARV
jgi:hypothetical protein